MIRKTPLQQLRESRNSPRKQREREQRIIDENKKTPLTRSQQNPQTRKLAAMEAFRKPVHWQNEQFIDPNQLTLADASNGEEFLEEHNAIARAMRSEAVDNFRFEADNTRRPRFTRTLRKPFERRGTPVVSPEQLRKDLINTGFPNQALEALGTTVYATNKLPRNWVGVFTSGGSQDVFSRRGKIGISSTKDDPRKRRFILAHELGHEAESLARGRVGYGEDSEWKENGKLGPSASAEGFADGISLRFGSKYDDGPTFESHRDMLGYNPDKWDLPENQAAFVAHRAHAWTTGELPEGSLPERMYRMGLNPHVRDALTSIDEYRLDRHKIKSPYSAPQYGVFDQDAPVHGPDQRLSGFVSLKDVARNLSEQFMETRKTGRQLSLLGEQDEYDTYDVEKIDWDN